MNEKKCDVCGTLLDLNKDKTYLVKTVNFFTKQEMCSDAIDCEQCGCQNILKERRMRVEDGRKETIKALEDAIVGGKTESLRRWAKDTIENSTIIIEALEKQLPKKPKQADEQRIRYCTTHVCPGCGKEFTGMVSEYCYHCGQRIEHDD